MCSSTLHNDAPLPLLDSSAARRETKWLKHHKQYVLMCLQQSAERHADWKEGCHACLPARLRIRQDAALHFAFLPLSVPATPAASLCQLHAQDTSLRQCFHHPLLRATLSFLQDINLLTCHTKRIHLLLLLKVLGDINARAYHSSQRHAHVRVCTCVYAR